MRVKAHEHGRKPNQSMHPGHQLGHLRHFNLGRQLIPDQTARGNQHR